MNCKGNIVDFNTRYTRDVWSYNNRFYGKNNLADGLCHRSCEQLSQQSTFNADSVKISHEARQKLNSPNATASNNNTEAGQALPRKKEVEAFDQYLADATTDKNATVDSTPSRPRSGAMTFEDVYEKIMAKRLTLPLEQKNLNDAINEFGISPLLGLPASLMLAPGSDAAKYEYYGLLKQCHDETVEEQNLDLQKYWDDFGRTSDAYAKKATEAIYSKLYSNPRAVELMQMLGMTAKTNWGVPYNPNYIA